MINGLGSLTTTHDLLERPSEQITPWNTAFIDYGPSGLVRKVDSTLFPSKEYEYDPLEQLQQEGNRTYSFDSLGNPTNAQVNPLNQILATDDTTLIYDTNGNPSHRIKPNGVTLYTYDALNRLTTIEKPGHPKVTFLYDPFSRLYAKQTDTTHFYLYNQDIEIGLLNAQNKILELKVLGLGIEGDIGAAVAIELRGEVFAPLHDFGGNIIGIVSAQGELVEKYEISAFGQEHCSSTPINPWRFNSKRAIEGFVFFGQRFYDPELGRWLTPDPAGSIDSPNLYLYVRNSPLNRLDLFGLDSISMVVDYDKEFFHNSTPNTTYQPPKFITLKVTTDHIQVDWLISSNVLHKIKCTPEEIATGKIDITKHFHEMFPSAGQSIALTSIMNGINTHGTGFQGFDKMSDSVMDKIGNDNHIIIGMYNSTEGFCKDVWRTAKEAFHVDTPIATVTRQALVAISEALYKINPNLIHLHIAHSEAGAIFNCAYHGMTPEQQALIKNHVYFMGIAPAVPISNLDVFAASNFYSKQDFFTGLAGVKGLIRDRKKGNNIQFLPCTSKWSERSGGFADHGFFGGTQQTGLKDRLEKIGEKYGGFYGQKN